MQRTWEALYAATTALLISRMRIFLTRHAAHARTILCIMTVSVRRSGMQQACARHICHAQVGVGPTPESDCKCRFQHHLSLRGACIHEHPCACPAGIKVIVVRQASVRPSTAVHATRGGMLTVSVGHYSTWVHQATRRRTAPTRTRRRFDAVKVAGAPSTS